MTGDNARSDSTRPMVNAGRLWAGGVATAAVAALIAIVGILLGRGLFDIVVHVLIQTMPRPMRFFGWVVGLATVVAVLAPFLTDGSTGARLYTAMLNLVLGIAIGSLVAGTARTATAVVRSRPVPPQYG